MAAEKTKIITSIGGQALIEGIMMRGPQKTAVAVRTPNSEISVEEEETTQLKDTYPIWGVPIIRGVAALIDSLKIGFKALNLSAEKSSTDEDEELSKFDLWLERKFGDKVMNVFIGIGSVLGMIFAIALFFWLPTWLVNILKPAVGGEIENWRSLIEGIIRIGVFVAYLALCSLQPDMKRMFRYHGAEHKTIFCYENNEPLTTENVKKHTRFHPRCGTSFMVIMILLGIIVGFFIPFTNPFLRTFVKILCIPLVVGVGYELLRICGKYDNRITRILAAPGLWVQRLTTKEPDDSMMEVAIAALKSVIPENGEDQIKL